MGVSKEIKRYQRKWAKDLQYITISILFIHLFQPSHENKNIIMRYGEPTINPA